MRGPIDFVVVGFAGNKFDGSILQALSDAIEAQIISLIGLSVISKDNKGVVTIMDVAGAGDEYLVDFSTKYPSQDGAITDEDVDEVSDLLENNTAAGLMIIEHLWAKPLKQAIADAGGVLVADGRIHPEAAEELTK